MPAPHLKSTPSASQIPFRGGFSIALPIAERSKKEMSALITDLASAISFCTYLLCDGDKDRMDSQVTATQIHLGALTPAIDDDVIKMLRERFSFKAF